MANFNKTIGKRRADKLAADSAQDMLRSANEFGLTAAARSRISAGGYAPPSTPSKFGDLIGNGTVVPMRRDDE